MNFSLSLLIALPVMGVLFSCSKPQPSAPQELEPPKTENRDMSALLKPNDFSSTIRLYIPCEIELIESEKAYIEVTAPANLLPYIQTEIKEITNFGYTTRHIRVESSIDNWKADWPSVKLKIHLPYHVWNLGLFTNGTFQIRYTTHTDRAILTVQEEAGSITPNVTIQASDLLSLEIGNTGKYVGGTYTVKGKSDFSRVHTASANSFDARELLLVKAQMYNKGTGDLHIQVSEQVNAIVEGSGNIEIEGHPSIHKVVTGTGQVVEK